MNLSGHEGEIPIPISSSTYNVGQSHVHSIIHQNTYLPPPPPPPHVSTEDHNNQNIKKGSSMVKYKECLKNHAASIGGNATDGCGEFMPDGEEGTLEALKCSACNCHRNFHRKEIEGEELNNFSSFRKLSIGGYNSSNNNHNILVPRPTPHSMIMPLQASESDEGYPRPPFAKKRFRTKFTPEQKAKMLAFAQRAEWKLQKQEESVVQQLCLEIGVKRRVLKVWMHNNKHSLAKKAPLPPSNLNESTHTGIADSRGGF